MKQENKQVAHTVLFLYRDYLDRPPWRSNFCPRNARKGRKSSGLEILME